MFCVVLNVWHTESLPLVLYNSLLKPRVSEICSMQGLCVDQNNSELWLALGSAFNYVDQISPIIDHITIPG